MSKIATGSAAASAATTPIIASEIIRSQINTTNTQNKGEVNRSYNPLNNFSFGGSDDLTRQTLQRSGWNERQINDFISNGEELKLDDNQEAVVPRNSDNSRLSVIDEQSAGENDTTIQNISVDSDLEQTIQQLFEQNGLNLSGIDSSSEQTEFDAFQSSEEMEMRSLINSELLNPNPEVVRDPEVISFRQALGALIITKLSSLTLDDIKAILQQIMYLYNKYKEWKNPPIQPPSNSGSDIDNLPPEPNEPLQKLSASELTQKPIPGHCRRQLYYDDQNRLRSIIICRASEDSDAVIYHEQ